VAYNTLDFRRFKETITVPTAGTWSTPVQVTNAGARGGLIGRLVVRFPAGSTTTNVDVRVYYGVYTALAATPPTVPDEDLAVELTGVVVAGSATVADIDENLALSREGAMFDTRPTLVSGELTDQGLWVSILSNTGTAADAVVTIEIRFAD